MEADPRAVKEFEAQADIILTRLAEELAAGNVSRDTTDAVERLMSDTQASSVPTEAPQATRLRWRERVTASRETSPEDTITEQQQQQQQPPPSASSASDERVVAAGGVTHLENKISSRDDHQAWESSSPRRKGKVSAKYPAPPSPRDYGSVVSGFTAVSSLTAGGEDQVLEDERIAREFLIGQPSPGSPMRLSRSLQSRPRDRGRDNNNNYGNNSGLGGGSFEIYEEEGNDGYGIGDNYHNNNNSNTNNQGQGSRAEDGTVVHVTQDGPVQDISNIEDEEEREEEMGREDFQPPSLEDIAAQAFDGLMDDEEIGGLGERLVTQRRLSGASPETVSPSANPTARRVLIRAVGDLDISYRVEVDQDDDYEGQGSQKGSQRTPKRDAGSPGRGHGGSQRVKKPEWNNKWHLADKSSPHKESNSNNKSNSNYSPQREAEERNRRRAELQGQFAKGRINESSTRMVRRRRTPSDRVHVAPMPTMDQMTSVLGKDPSTVTRREVSDALSGLTPETMHAMRTMRNPPPYIRKALGAALAILGCDVGGEGGDPEMTWSQARASLSDIATTSVTSAIPNPDAALVDSLSRADPPILQPGDRFGLPAAVRSAIGDNGFRPGRIDRELRGAGPLASWVIHYAAYAMGAMGCGEGGDGQATSRGVSRRGTGVPQAGSPHHWTDPRTADLLRSTIPSGGHFRCLHTPNNSNENTKNSNKGTRKSNKGARNSSRNGLGTVLPVLLPYLAPGIAAAVSEVSRDCYATVRSAEGYFRNVAAVAERQAAFLEGSQLGARPRARLAAVGGASRKALASFAVSMTEAPPIDDPGAGAYVCNTLLAAAIIAWGREGVIERGGGMGPIPPRQRLWQLVRASLQRGSFRPVLLSRLHLGSPLDVPTLRRLYPLTTCASYLEPPPVPTAISGAVSALSGFVIAVRAEAVRAQIHSSGASGQADASEDGASLPQVAGSPGGGGASSVSTPRSLAESQRWTCVRERALRAAVLSSAWLHTTKISASTSVDGSQNAESDHPPPPSDISPNSNSDDDASGNNSPHRASGKSAGVVVAPPRGAVIITPDVCPFGNAPTSILPSSPSSSSSLQPSQSGDKGASSRREVESDPRDNYSFGKVDQQQQQQQRRRPGSPEGAFDFTILDSISEMISAGAGSTAATTTAPTNITSSSSSSSSTSVLAPKFNSSSSNSTSSLSSLSSASVLAPKSSTGAFSIGGGVPDAIERRLRETFRVLDADGDGVVDLDAIAAGVEPYSAVAIARSLGLRSVDESTFVSRVGERLLSSAASKNGAFSTAAASKNGTASASVSVSLDDSVDVSYAQVVDEPPTNRPPRETVNHVNISNSLNNNNNNNNNVNNNVNNINNINNRAEMPRHPIHVSHPGSPRISEPDSVIGVSPPVGGGRVPVGNRHPQHQQMNYQQQQQQQQQVRPQQHQVFQQQLHHPHAFGGYQHVVMVRPRADSAPMQAVRVTQSMGANMAAGGMGPNIAATMPRSPRVVGRVTSLDGHVHNLAGQRGGSSESGQGGNW